MTQELIANMLGVRREGVTEAAGKLQKAGADQLQPRPHHRARPPEAGGGVCECYAVVRAETARLLPQPEPGKPSAGAR